MKYGSLLLDAPFESKTSVALAIILVPTAINMLKWQLKSQEENEDNRLSSPVSRPDAAESGRTP